MRATIFPPNVTTTINNDLFPIRRDEHNGLINFQNLVSSIAPRLTTEGTWTPSIVGTSSAGFASYTQRVGIYIRFNNLVFFSCNLSYANFSGTGSFRITGLPFAARNVNGYSTYFTCAPIAFNYNSTQARQIFAKLSANTTYFSMVELGDNTTEQLSNAAATGIFAISGHYFI